MTKEELVIKTNEAINNWAKFQNKFIVAIDGYAGIGKTTLLKSLAELNPHIIPVHLDDFILPREVVREKIKEKLSKAEDLSKVFELEICDHKKLEDFLNTFRNTDTLYNMNAYDGSTGKVNIPKNFDFSRKILVIEGVFMFHPELPRSKFWDKRIYMKGDIEKITDRRIKREKERWGRDYIPETQPDSYFRLVVTALERYIKLHDPEKLADMVLLAD